MTISPQQVVGPTRSGRRICYAVDTRPTQTLYRLCEDVDIAFLDGMFLPEHLVEAEEKGHMTVCEAARVAFQAGVRRAVLVHISPRYKEEDVEKLAGAVAKEFERAEVGRDLGRYQIHYRED
jgi:ribonuclease Z